jgi:hypothetical protein
MIFALLLILGSQSTTHDHCDLAELNSFHDCNGRFVYDQVIFYEWRPDLSRYHVRAWCLVEDRDLVSRRPQRDYRTGLYVTRWQDRDQNVMRTITATHYRQSWTQVDPERANKKILDERDRLQLTKRSVTKQEVTE